MPYYVKWLVEGMEKAVEHPRPFPRRQEALEFACGILPKKPQDIWIEDEIGEPVVREPLISTYLRVRGPTRS
jgi:hypothetical protein